MAVHEPNTRVIGQKRNHQMTFGGKKGSITARRVVLVEGDVRAIWSRALGEDVVVETVKVNWVRDILLCLDGEVDSGILLGDTNDGGGGGEG